MHGTSYELLTKESLWSSNPSFKFTLEFEQLTIRDDEQFKDFYTKLSDITNTAYTLGKKYSESKIVRKILRSLPDRFHSKVTVIEESKEIENMKVEEFMVSLMTYELHLQRRKKEKRSSIAFKIKNHEDEVDCEESETNENMAMLIKQFKNFLKRNQKGKNLNTSPQQKKRFPINTKQNPTTSMNRSDNRIQCHECEGFGLIASECTNTLKKYHTKKAMNITWSEDDEKDSDEDEDEDDRTTVDQVTSLTVNLTSHIDSVKNLIAGSDFLATTSEEPVHVYYNCSSMNKKL
ncbi:Uncharacterized protein Adt_45163 [Abeliophyllum distichum]|uniref:UBN2 domain-containing protein n=1 Tax=Abeliophyllum distichum TaxID=126358 RepID=A0ABD1PCY3_9LAMI